MANKVSRLVSRQGVHFPFTAVAAQAQFKLALLLVAVNPLIGGVLVSGPRGSAKSTLAKGLADILPEHEGRPHPFVTLPLGASEEMLIGSLNLQQVLEEQRVEFQAGLLAKAHNGVLYVDEVNLLPDNLVDQLLDVAASRINTIERDGISHQHAAEFILLGTMNPDEGELRPQLLDRFGLSLSLSNQYSIEERMQVVKLRERFDQNPSAFVADYQQEQQGLKQKIASAQQLLPKLICDDTCRRLIAEGCIQACVDGLRADIVWAQAAIAYASLQQRNKVTEEDVLAVESLVLNHRRNHRQNNHKQNNHPPGQPPPNKPFSRPPEEQQTAPSSTERSQQGDWGAMPADSQNQAIQTTENFTLNPSKASAGQAGAILSRLFAANRLKGSANGMGASVNPSRKVNWFSTFVNHGWPAKLERLHFFNRKQGETIIHLVLLDTSASILKQQGFGKAKGLILQIAKAAYLHREQFTLIGFGRQQVEVLMGLRRAPKLIEQFLDNIEASGGTPLHEALQHAESFQQQQRRKHHRVHFKNTIITDGRVSELRFKGRLQGELVVVDVEQSAIKRGKSQQLAALLQGQYLPLTT